MKFLKDFRVIENCHISESYSLLKLNPADNSILPDIKPGQFVQVLINGADVLLRRPISVNNVDKSTNQLWLLVRRSGKATNILADYAAGELLNLLYPLGNGFDINIPQNSSILLIGGGIGTAPLLYLGKTLKANNINFEFLIGAKSKNDLLQVDLMKEIANVNISTDDGSCGEKGIVTLNSCLGRDWNKIYCCGPVPMMKAFANIATTRNIDCEVSLENMMACGLGACLCCVEKTVKGNVCVCKEGPVFNIKELTW